MGSPPLSFNAWLRYAVIEEMLADLPVRTVLEIGCGGGAVGARLAERYDYVGLEPDRTSYERASQWLGSKVLEVDHTGLDPAAVFDLVCAFEVLEHIDDDRGMLEAWRALVKPGGWVLLSAPAHPERWGAHDEFAGHLRRYESDQMITLLEDAGFSDARVRVYGFPLGNLLERARNALAARQKRARSAAEATAASGRWMQPPSGLGWVTQAVTAPFRRFQGVNGRGTGLVARARRSD